MKKELEELMNVDRKFCEDSQTLKSEAWANNMADEVLIGSEQHLPYDFGKETVIPKFKQFYELEDLHFIWEPKHAFISDDNTLGVTTGIYTRTFIADGKEVKRIGKYMTTWKKINGEWKFVFDMGN